MMSYLYKKSDKNKKWKSLYFVLICMDGNTGGGGGGGTGSSTDTHLCFYESPKVNYVASLAVQESRTSIYICDVSLCRELNQKD